MVEVWFYRIMVGLFVCFGRAQGGADTVMGSMKLESFSIIYDVEGFQRGVLVGGCYIRVRVSGISRSFLDHRVTNILKTVFTVTLFKWHVESGRGFQFAQRVIKFMFMTP